MTTKQLDDWFCSLNLKQKEHISCKVLIKQGKDPKKGLYPNCSVIWKELNEETKQKIHDHCTDEHNMWIQEGGDGPIFSF